MRMRRSHSCHVFSFTRVPSSAGASNGSSTLYEISQLLTKTADGFEKMAKRGKFSDSESGTATTESDDRRKSILEVIYLV